jgi:hypothetical protein
VIALIGIAILDRCNKILSSVQLLRRRFLGDPPTTGTVKNPNLAFEFFSIKEKIAPLFFMPLAHTAGEIKRMYDMVAKEFEETLEVWRSCERSEMEAFAARNPPDGRAFPPSDNLRRALKAWSLARHKANVIEGWTNLFAETYVGLLSGKITLGDAEERLKGVDSLSLRMRDHSEVEKIFHSWSSNWDADRWKRRWNHLREMERWKRTAK